VKMAAQQRQRRYTERLRELRHLCLSECFSSWRIYTRRVNEMRNMLLESTNSKGSGGSSVPSRGAHLFLSTVRASTASGGFTTAEYLT
jgi:hypothetical protein